MQYDVVDLIMQDHREVERLFDELKNHPEKRPLLTPVLCGLLVAHSRAEEGEVYPAAKAAGGDDEVEHSQEEHAEAERLLAKLLDTEYDSPQYEKALQDVVDSITHHVEEEEKTVLPGMRKRLSAERRYALGEAFARSRADHLGDMPGQATREELLLQAKNLGLDGVSSMSKEQLRKELQKAASS
ncbi:hemerythrin domain-containing protein [Lentzea albidocapillata]|uniref:Hemerythrin HHE cation binding domain-containing protein n=1 Tax=Lentzea albidocapillata TaxID=40571 RepID=A0A1W2BVP8_9PSEU|nr:hemerythrin domain-containing protein [Lentzea albidocapillata]SMC76979.1 Hemerythrin HHE cation binding domain-containing protein [Lentzea albidocapillata]